MDSLVNSFTPSKKTYYPSFSGHWRNRNIPQKSKGTKQWGSFLSTEWLRCVWGLPWTIMTRGLENRDLLELESKLESELGPARLTSEVPGNTVVWGSSLGKLTDTQDNSTNLMAGSSQPLPQIFKPPISNYLLHPGGFKENRLFSRRSHSRFHREIYFTGEEWKGNAHFCILTQA